MRNTNFYDQTKVTHIIGIDWIKEMIDLGSLHAKSYMKLVEMDATDIEYDDEVFDTVIDTFGLQASHNPYRQYKEMKRVCKVNRHLNQKGGLILIMEIGQSFWTITNYRTIKSAINEFRNHGQVLFYNYEKMIEGDPEVKILDKKRKLHGRLHCYVLEKI